MKRKLLANIVIFLLIAGMTGIYSCGKKKLEKATTSAEDNDLVESLFTDIFNISSSANHDADDTLGTSKTGSTLTAFTDTCADIKVITDTTNDGQWYAKSIIIDFGSTGCEHNGRIRKGKIIITRDGPWYTVGTSTTITLEKFSIDDYKIIGEKKITTKEAKIQWAWPIVTASFDIVVTDVVVTTPEGGVISWKSTRNHTWTWELSGIYLKVTGSASGTNRNEVDFIITITKTLVAKALCPYIIEGTLKITSDDVKKDIVIDYGDGTCDDKATITIGNKKSKDFTLK